jgi:hypothetical protein
VKNENVKWLCVEKHGREFLNRPKLRVVAPKVEEEAASQGDRFPTLL